MVQMNGLTRVVLCAQEQCPPAQKRQSAWRLPLPLCPATEATQHHNTVRVRAHLVVGGAEAPAHVLVVEHLHLEREVLLQLRTGGEEAASAGRGAGWSQERRRRTFLMIMTRNGSLMPSVFCGSAGHVMNVVEMFVDMISSTDDWMSLSVMRLMCPFITFLSQICSGLEPIEYLRRTTESQPVSLGRPWRSGHERGL